ncbi:MAG: hypothetical protein RL339_506 [Pseudomonadota bacterium]|jgi:hypothetical protein
MNALIAAVQSKLGAGPATKGADAPAKPARPPIPRDEWRHLANWLMVWVVLANVGYMLMWIIGAPPRQSEIMAIGVIGLMVRTQLPWVQGLAFVAVSLYSLLKFIASLFNLAITSLLSSFKFFLELDPAQSIEYISGGLVVILLCGVAFWGLRRPARFADTRLVLIAGLLVILLSLLDNWMSFGMRGHYNRQAEAGAPFESARSKSGLLSAAHANGRNVMVIVVESLGLPAGNPDLQRLLFAHYKTPAVSAKFSVSFGDTTYYNSTTAAEVRELCGRWGDYYDLLEAKDSSCLPAIMARKGYETRAYHSFTGDFFDRRTWYPNIGFQHRTFAPELIAGGARNCGGVFPGACDRDVPQQLAAQLRAATKPQFIYWLTVNSHLPVPPGMNLDVDQCGKLSPTLAAKFPMICRQASLWDQLDAAIVKEITTSDFPPTDILIVGDHMPPYFDRNHRVQFAPDRVPWMMLRWKGDAKAAAPQVAMAALAK